MKILIVDDEKDIRDILISFLYSEGYVVVCAKDGDEAVRTVNEDINRDIGLVILDINMPVMDGITACRKIRKKRLLPIVFLTAFSDEENISRCFTNGADDYIVKPFKKSELILRISSLLRRCYEYNYQENKSIITSGQLVIDSEKELVLLDGKRVSTTYIEYSILCFLAQKPGNIYSIKQIYEEVWKEEFLLESGNTVMVHIRNLRKKINEEGHTYIKNIWGKGYYFEK